MKVAALVPYQPGSCAGQRFRIEPWARALRGRGVEVTLMPFADEGLTDVLYRPRRYVAKAGRMLGCYAGQLGRLLRADRPDLVYIYREAALAGPALLERLTRRWQAPIVYDLDEPLFVPYASPRNRLFSRLRWASKIDELFGLSDRVFAVNRAIAGYAGRFCDQVSVVPMAVDLQRYRPSPVSTAARPLTVGWVGTRTTQPNLELIAEPLRRLARSHGAGLRVLADEPMTLPGLDLEFLPWDFHQEVPRLQACQIGVVPVKPHPWTPWKFFFKLIQFMSLGMPVVASPVGSNLEIIEDGANGFLADGDDQWYDRLRALADDPALRRSMGQAARQTAETRFGLDRQIDTVESLWQQACGARAAARPGRWGASGRPAAPAAREAP
jgi:glycosyltransferase involved in cell wall biosynthesis